MESLVEGDLIRILNEKGIEIAHTSTNVKQRGRGDNSDYDIITVNGQEARGDRSQDYVTSDSVKDYLKNLRKFTTSMPHDKNKTIYGAVAWLRAEEESDLTRKDWVCS